MIRHAFLIFSILVSVAVEAATTAAYNPTDVFLFNCGDTFNNTDDTGRNWTAEDPKTFPTNSENASFPAYANSQGPSVLLIPYKEARIFQSDFTYSFSVSPGQKFIRLYFYPTQYGFRFDAASSFFSVTVNNGFTLLKNFSADLTVNASKDFTVVKEFIVSVDQGPLKLTFTPAPNSLAFVNGIEIVSMPDRLYSKGGFDDKIANVGSSSTIDFKIDNSTAFETVYRLNAGGYTDNDTGMFRNWLSDNAFLQGSPGVVPNVPDLKINYTAKTPAYVAPEDVYATCRVMGLEYPDLNPPTWLFKVNAGFNYLVRLHFCEIQPEVTKPGQRVFSIFIGNLTAKREMDVFKLSGGSRIPMYLDFNVYVGSGSDLELELHPFNDTNTKSLDPILNGVEILKMSDPNKNLGGPNPAPRTLEDIFIPFRETPRWKRHALVVGAPIGLATLVVAYMLLMRHIERNENKKENNKAIMAKALLKHYTYAELKKITKSFSHIVGKGGFGIVYGGNLRKGRKVAVKVLKDSKGNGEDFINEVASMSQTSHINIVSMLGFCFEGSKRAIIYEFLENGSLDQFLSRNKSSTLNATTLYGIALGVSRGLEYLHYGCKTRIVHFDIKPQNILLDDNLCPKVSDFGLAKLCEKRESILSLMDARGTIGYIAPEVFSRMYGGISHKSDVYSYGMLVLEMIGARNKEIAETITPNASSSYFPDWIYKDLENGDQQTWIFGDEITKEEKEIVKKMILVSLWCIQPCPLDRPPMNRVVEMMEGSLDALEVPPKPSMHISTGFISKSSSLVEMMEERFDALEDPPKPSMHISTGHTSESSSIVDGREAG
ncbi:hypothetical protein AALP_AA5G038800 [Arabis alpina]|uniref:Protein kinase domain-containing protein n=1 Tax=Arabis alpina TaxID=50452 RepID=A0A087GUT0_ARAAL|nr:hypothetical protein AALP_AA5G038800 [Arabis alpina]